jgi:Alternative complex III, ActD subunit
MSDNGKRTTRNALYLAEFDNPGSCLHAAEKLRDAGYRHFDAHTPFPVHGMDKAMGMTDSKLGWISLICGLTGVSTAWLMMWWMNGIDYALVIGGKPPYSLPSMVPIMFELTVLFTCIGTVLGMLHLNRLPRHNHPIFESDRFRGVSDDRFFVSIAAEDPKFHLEKTKALLETCQPAAIELVKEEL